METIDYKIKGFRVQIGFKMGSFEPYELGFIPFLYVYRNEPNEPNT